MRSMMFLLLAACGAQPGQPVLANAPRPNPAAVAGVAAATAAAITLASPDTAGRKPEKNQDENKQPIQVKEHVTSSVLDRLDKAEQDPAGSDPADKDKAKQPASAPTEAKAPRDALDFSQP